MFCLRVFVFCVDLALSLWPLWLFVSPPSLPRSREQEAVDAFREHVKHNITLGKGALKRMAAFELPEHGNPKRVRRRR